MIRLIRAWLRLRYAARQYLAVEQHRRRLQLAIDHMEAQEALARANAEHLQCLVEWQAARREFVAARHGLAVAK